MAITGIFTNRRPTIGGFTFDATLEEADELQTEVTQFPIENGTIGNDHAATRNQRFTLRVGVSDNRFKALAAQASTGNVLANLQDLGLPDENLRALIDSATGAAAGIAAGAVARTLGGRASAIAGIGASIGNAAFAAGQAATRSADALETIRQTQRSAALFTLTTSKGTYENCIITNTRRETNPRNEQGLELVIEIEQLRIMESRLAQRATLPVQGDDTASTQAQPLQPRGRVSVELER